MRGILLALAMILGGSGSEAMAQSDPAGTDIETIIEGCVPAEQRAQPLARLSAAARSAILSCVARESARLINAQLPLRVDDITTLRSVAADGPQLTYLNDVEIDAAGLPAERGAALVASTRAYVCGEPAMRAALSAGNSYRYIWFDRSGAEFDRVTIERCSDEAEEEDDEEDEVVPVTIARRAERSAHG